MPSEAQAAADAPLSIDQAVGLLNTPIEQDEPAVESAPAGEPEASEQDTAPVAEDAADDAESEAVPPADEDLDPDADPVIEDEEDPEPESDPPPVIAAPKSWDATERATFAKLPSAAQEIILKRETERDRAVSKAQQEAGEARKSVETELVGLARYKTVFDQVVTKAQEVFAGRWENVDWVAHARQDPEAYAINRAEFEAERDELQRVQAAAAEAEKVKSYTEQVEFQNYLQAEAAKLPEIAPELVDPKEGAARRSKVGQFLLDNGASAEQLQRISATELAIAYDAMRFREGKVALTRAAAKPAAQAPRPTPPRAAAAPSAAPPAAPQKQRTVELARERLNRSGSIDDAVAVLLAKG